MDGGRDYALYIDNNIVSIFRLNNSSTTIIFSNVDISNLFYNSPDVAGLCTRREKISQAKFNTIFVKGDVSKYYGFILVNYSNSNDRLSIGDVVMNKRIISDFKEYIYD